MAILTTGNAAALSRQPCLRAGDPRLEPARRSSARSRIRPQPARRGARSAVVPDPAMAVRRVPGRGCRIADRCAARLRHHEAGALPAAHRRCGSTFRETLPLEAVVERELIAVRPRDAPPDPARHAAGAGRRRPGAGDAPSRAGRLPHGLSVRRGATRRRDRRRDPPLLLFEGAHLFDGLALLADIPRRRATTARSMPISACRRRMPRRSSVQRASLRRGSPASTACPTRPRLRPGPIRSSSISSPARPRRSTARWRRCWRRPMRKGISTGTPSISAPCRRPEGRPARRRGAQDAVVHPGGDQLCRHAEPALLAVRGSPCRVRRHHRGDHRRRQAAADGVRARRRRTTGA